MSHDQHNNQQAKDCTLLDMLFNMKIMLESPAHYSTTSTVKLNALLHNQRPLHLLFIHSLHNLKSMQDERIIIYLTATRQMS